MASIPQKESVWEDIYQQGHIQKAPWDCVVSFVYRNRPKDKKEKDTKILEIGCGTASNLKFFASEGFDVTGSDISSTAIAKAQEIFAKNNLYGTFQVADFQTMVFESDSFDLAIERGALVCVGKSVQKLAVEKIHNALKMGGKFLLTPYAKTHASYKHSTKIDDDLCDNITGGTLMNVGKLRFFNRDDIEDLLPKTHWNILSLSYETKEDLLAKNDDSFHSSWLVVAEKK